MDLDESMLAALVAAVGDRDERDRKRDEQWGYAEELLARLVESVHNLTLITVDMHGKWKQGRPDPLHITRPGEKTEPKNVVSWGQMGRRLSGGR